MRLLSGYRRGFDHCVNSRSGYFEKPSKRSSQAIQELESNPAKNINDSRRGEKYLQHMFLGAKIIGTPHNIQDFTCYA
jgi:hypothetical protein